MGMDVIGQNPDSEVGEYFQQNVWGWHPLWQYIEDRFPEFARKVPNPHNNDGDGLDSLTSQELGLLLVDEIESGKALRYVASRDRSQDSSVTKGNQPQWVEEVRNLVIMCGSTLVSRHCDPAERMVEMAELIDHFSNKRFELNVLMIREFADFLQHCGGFEIW